MTVWMPKRFWSDARVADAESGWQVLLDGRMLRTPAKAPLVLPSVALAEAIAEEWQAQGEHVDPMSMPCTRSANAAIDNVARQKTEVAAHIAVFGETDLCCYRAEGPETLRAEQARAWNALLDWARDELGAPLVQTAGIVPVPQPARSLAALSAHVSALDAFALTALHDLVSLSGSLLIGLAALEDRYEIEDLWRRSRVDEDFQERQWGIDEEATGMAARKRQDFLHAARFYRLSRPAS
ncbi:ATP12 family chaperone protein [Tropicimonas sp. IMCC6043]|uniref:ATP12 family chaperone protein n=1 Tax=Tropicimonas sp. IMCC6043 TaxID=2510645 RepID=UPI00101C8271|nr:ATP12 family protein [Tropicimonas sp. IMCC6043]RYH08962.1 ATPase [Tropicimonas sp. IMCC6043]